MNISQGPHYIDDTLVFTVTTHRFDTGVLIDADSVPTYRIYEDETGTAILTGSMAKLDDANTTGFYSEQVTLSAANGFEAGKSYSIYIEATVNSVAGGVSGSFRMSSLSRIADAVLTRDWTEIPSTAWYSMLNALRHIRNKWSISGTAKTVFEEDGTTAAYTTTVTADETSGHITGDTPDSEP